jgi:hypothetical protein
MAVALRESKRFAASSPVTRYWLANCIGFSLAGGCRGTVERILADGDPWNPSLLEVRTSRRRLRRVPTSAVIAVVPSERVLVVGQAGRATPDRRREVTLYLRRGTQIVARVLTDLFRLGRRGWAVTSPAVARGCRRGGREAVRLVRSVPWQSYGRSARSATTRLSRDLSTRLSRLRTTSSDLPSETSSAGEAGTTSST